LKSLDIINVLLIDNNAASLKRYERLINKEIEYKCHTASNLDDAIEITRNLYIHIVISALPVSENYKLLDTLKTEFPGIIIITRVDENSTSEEELRELFKKGVFDFFLNQRDTRRLVESMGRAKDYLLHYNRVAKLAGQIFLSYAKEDLTQVKKLYDYLKYYGYTPWLDETDIIGGTRWKRAIEKSIRESDFFIACLSKHAVNKRGTVQKEISIGLDILDEIPDEDIFFIPIRFEECDVPARISELQFINLFKPDGYDKLMQALQHGLKQRIERQQKLSG